MRNMPLQDIEEEALRLIRDGQKVGIVLRLLGGLAVKMRCPSSRELNLARQYNDIDLITDSKSGGKLGEFFDGMGYSANRSLNLLNGDRRQVYHDESHNRQVDIFVGDFEMCHRLPFSQRLNVDALTTPLVELFLTKIQIVELNEKDIKDLVCLLIDHPLKAEDGEYVNSTVLGGLCAKDWGLYTTVSMNLEKLNQLIYDGVVKLNEDQRVCALERIEEMQKLLEAAPKTTAWKMRALAGKRLPWYTEVEEIRR
jgi:hypothetical protein